MRSAVRLNFCQLGAVASLLISFFFFRYQEFDFPAWLPFAPSMDKRATAPLFNFFLFLSLMFSIRSGQIYKSIPESQTPFSFKLLYFFMLSILSIIVLSL